MGATGVWENMDVWENECMCDQVCGRMGACKNVHMTDWMYGRMDI